MAGHGWQKEPDSHDGRGEDTDSSFYKAQCSSLCTYSVTHSSVCVNSLYINAIFKVKFRRLLRVKPAFCCSTDKTSFEFSLAKCQSKKSNFRERILQVFRPLI